MKPIFISAAIVALSWWGGMGVESPHPAWFSSEPIEIFTHQQQPPSIAATQLNYKWIKLGTTEGKTLWGLLLRTPILVPFPIEVEADDERILLLVVPPSFGIIEMPLPADANVTLKPKALFRFYGDDLVSYVYEPGKVVMKSGADVATVIVKAGQYHKVPLSSPYVETTPEKLPPSPVETVIPSSECSWAVIPNIEFNLTSLFLELEKPTDAVTLKVGVPEGWSVTPKIPLAIGGLREISGDQPEWELKLEKVLQKIPLELSVKLSDSVKFGEQKLVLEWGNRKIEIKINVKRCLSPIEAVLRWDPDTGDLSWDFPLRDVPTAEQLEWAAVWYDEKVSPPKACHPLSWKELKELGDLFAQSH